MDDTKTQACQWKYCESECSWDTQCDNKYQFMNDGPKENDYKFCPGCGKPVTLAGDEQPAIVEPEEIKALASATCSTAPSIEEMNKVAWEIASDVAFYALQGFTTKEIAELWTKGKKWSDMIREITKQ